MKKNPILLLVVLLIPMGGQVFAGDFDEWRAKELIGQRRAALVSDAWDPEDPELVNMLSIGGPSGGAAAIVCGDDQDDQDAWYRSMIAKGSGTSLAGGADGWPFQFNMRGLAAYRERVHTGGGENSRLWLYVGQCWAKITEAAIRAEVGPTWTPEHIAREWKLDPYVEGATYGTQHPTTFFATGNEFLIETQVKFRPKDIARVGRPSLVFDAWEESLGLFPGKATAQDWADAVGRRVAYFVSLGWPDPTPDRQYLKILALAREVAARPFEPRYGGACEPCPETFPAPSEPSPPRSPPGDSLPPLDPPQVDPAPNGSSWTFSPTVPHPRLSRPVATPGSISWNVAGLADDVDRAASEGWDNDNNLGIIWLTVEPGTWDRGGKEPDWKKLGGFVIYFPQKNQLCFRVGTGKRRPMMGPEKKCQKLVKKERQDGRRVITSQVTNDMDFSVRWLRSGFTNLTVSSKGFGEIATFQIENGSVPPFQHAYFGHGCGPSDGCTPGDPKNLGVQEEIDNKLRVGKGLKFSGDE